jgi:hypothetical protein
VPPTASRRGCDATSTSPPHRYAGMQVHYNASGAFHDDLVRTPKGWRIQFRRFEVYFGDPLEIAKTA